MYQPFNPAIRIGAEAADPWKTSDYCPVWVFVCFQARGSDAALIGLDPNVPPLLRGAIRRTSRLETNALTDGPLDVDPVNQFLYVVARQQGGAAAGTIVEKIGRSTGWTRGNLDVTCADVSVAASDNQAGFALRCANRMGLWTGGGDSGAPVFAEQSTDANGTTYVVLLGIMSMIEHESQYPDGIPRSMTSWYTNISSFDDELSGYSGAQTLNVIATGPRLPVSGYISGASAVGPGVSSTWTAALSNGTPPYTYSWSGDVSGSGSSVTASFTTDSQLILDAWDAAGKHFQTSRIVTVASCGGQIQC